MSVVDFDPNLNGQVKQSGTGPGIEAGSMQEAWTGGAMPLGMWAGDKTADPGVPTSQDLDTMLRLDGTARSIEQALTLPLRSADCQIIPAAGDYGQAAWLREQLEEMPDDLRIVIAQLAGACLYGKTAHEIVLVIRDGRLCPERISPRPWSNTRIVYDAHGRPQSLVQTPPGQTETVGIPPERSLIYLHNQDRDPRNGYSDFLPAYAAHMTKRRIVGLWKLFLGRQAIPWATATGRTSDVQEARDLARRVATLLSGGVVGLAQGEAVGILNAAGSASQSFQDALTYMDQQMFLSTLTQFLTLGQAKVGSFALSQTHADQFEQGRTAQLHEMEAVLDQLARKLVTRNWGVSAPVPKFRFGALSETNLTSAVTLLQAIAASASPPPQIAGAFLNELIIRVATLLGLDDVAVQADIKAAADGQGTPAGQIAAGTAAAAKLVAAVMPGATTEPPAAPAQL